MEWEHGIAGNKPAKEWKGKERNHTFYRRLPVYKLLESIVNRGHTSAAAIAMVDAVYPYPRWKLGKICDDIKARTGDGTLHYTLA